MLFFLIVGFLGLWTAWFAAARVAVYAATGVARLEVDRENHPVDAPVAGRVVDARLSVSRLVKAGDVLLELDAIPERLARNEERARLAPAASQLDSLKEELIAQQRALEEERSGAQAAMAESQAKAQQTASAAEFAAEEAKRLSSLQLKGLVSDLDALRAANLSAERQSEARSAEFASRRLIRDLDAREQDRLVQIARLKREVAALRGTRGQALAASERLGYEIEQRQVRAPISGTLAEVSQLRIGSMVASGDRICTIVPDGALKVVALFPPSVALGRIRVGHAARVRFEGFPWTQYGSAAAHVSSVAGELHDGQIRVELMLDPGHGSVIPFQHGLPAEVDIEIERVSPAALVLRSVGARMLVTAARP